MTEKSPTWAANSRWRGCTQALLTRGLVLFAPAWRSPLGLPVPRGCWFWGAPLRSPAAPPPCVPRCQCPSPELTPSSFVPLPPQCRRSGLPHAPCPPVSSLSSSPAGCPQSTPPWPRPRQPGTRLSVSLWGLPWGTRWQHPSCPWPWAARSLAGLSWGELRHGCPHDKTPCPHLPQSRCPLTPRPQHRPRVRDEEGELGVSFPKLQLPMSASPCCRWGPPTPPPAGGRGAPHRSGRCSSF